MSDLNPARRDGPVRLAVCGLGRWGRRLVDSVQHVSAEVCFTHGVSREPRREAAFARRAGLALTADYGDVLRHPDIDAVVLATPHSQHRDEIVAAVRHGKHVFVEKPITLTRADAEHAVAAVRDAGLALGIGFGRRFTPAFVEMLKRVRAGEIGEVLHVEGQSSGPSGYRLVLGNWRSDPVEGPAGAMTARGIHVLDAMIAIAGPVSSVFCRSERKALAVPVDDTTSALLGFTRGATGLLTTLFATGDFWRLQAFGAKGWLAMPADNVLVARDLAGLQSTIEFNPLDKERAALEAFGRAVRGIEPFPVVAAEAVNGIAVLEAMVRSAAERVEIAIAP